jgi:hypothetical protein
MQQAGGECRHGLLGEQQPLGLKSSFITYKDYLGFFTTQMDEE